MNFEKSEEKLELLARHFDNQDTGFNSGFRCIWEFHSMEKDTKRAILCFLEVFTKKGEQTMTVDPITNILTISYNQSKNGVHVVFEINYDGVIHTKENFDTLNDVAISTVMTIETVQEKELLDLLREENTNLKYENTKLKQELELLKIQN